ncbi:hypothetical protein GQ457_18G010280 [Hibiscus cannabinus]
MEATALETDSPDMCNRCVGDCPPKVNTVAPKTLYTQSSEWTMAVLLQHQKTQELKEHYNKFDHLWHLNYCH